VVVVVAAVLEDSAKGERVVGFVRVTESSKSSTVTPVGEIKASNDDLYEEEEEDDAATMAGVVDEQEEEDASVVAFCWLFRDPK